MATKKIEIQLDLKGAVSAEADLKKVATAGGDLGKVASAVAPAGTAADKAAASTISLQRANVLLSGVLSGNVVTAANAARGALTAMLGPMGLVIAAATAIGTKLYSIHQEQRAEQAARAADNYAFALMQGREKAEDLAKASVEAFAAALAKAREYYKETADALERQITSIQKIARARLALEQTKIRSDNTLSAEQKILAEQALINEHEALSLAQKGDLLTRQQELAAQAKANAERELEAAKAALDAAKQKPREAWIDAQEISRLEGIKKEIEDKIDNAKATVAVARAGNLDGNVKLTPDTEANQAMADLLVLRKELAEVEKSINRERERETVEARRALEVGSLESNKNAAAAGFEKTKAALDAANLKLKDFQDTEEKTAALEKQNRDARAAEEAKDAAKREAEKKELFDLQTQAIAAEAAGNTKLAEQLREQIQIKQIAREFDGKEPALIKQRSDAVTAANAKERAQKEAALARSQEEQKLQTDLADIAARRSAIEANQFLTNEQKQQAILPLIEEENRLLAEKLAILDKIIEAEKDPAKRLEFQRERGTTSRKIDSNNADAGNMQPRSLRDEMAIGAAKASDALGTNAQIAARSWAQAAESMRTNMGSALGDIFMKTTSVGRGLRNAAASIAESWIRSGAQMLSDWIHKHTIMQLWTSLTEKKAVTEKAGTVAIKGALETQETVQTVAGATTRGQANTQEAGSGLIGAAIKAMNAVANIPYVGPILAIAAMAAIMAAGMALLSGGFKKGGFTGYGGDDEVAGPAHKNEWVIPAPIVRAIGIENIPSMLAAAADGAADVSILPGTVAAAMERPAYGELPRPGSAFAPPAQPPAGKTSISIAVVDDKRRATRWLGTQSGTRMLNDKLARSAFERGQRR